MSSIQSIELAASRLWTAQEQKTPCEPIREIIGDTDIQAAYEVQKVNVQRRLDAGAKRIGAKIGLTSPAVQKQLGVDQPDFGIVFNDTQIFDGDSISCGEILQPKAEAEIAFVLNSDLPLGNYTQDDILDATEFVCVAIEIVGSRVLNWNIRITDTVADNASASHFVLGNQQLDPKAVDFVNCQMSLSVNGEIASTGAGSACMGSPVAAVVWLANTMVEMGTPLKKGDIILSGALGPMVAMTAGQYFEANVEGFGKVSFHTID